MIRSLVGLVGLVSCIFGSVACGQDAEYTLDESFGMTTEADGRVTITATVRCTGAGDDDCEAPSEPYCVSASWSGASPPVAETDVQCSSRRLKKVRTDFVVLKVTSLAPVPKEKLNDVYVSLDGSGVGGVSLPAK